MREQVGGRVVELPPGHRADKGLGYRQGDPTGGGDRLRRLVGRLRPLVDLDPDVGVGLGVGGRSARDGNRDVERVVQEREQVQELGKFEEIADRTSGCENPGATSRAIPPIPSSARAR